MKNTLYSAIYKDWYPFHSLVDRIECVFKPEHLKNTNSFLVLWGGEDISPSIYKEKPNRYTFAEETPSNRDIIEINLAKKAIDLGIPIIGICRGAQLMCALSGGKLIQHIENHGRSHLFETIKNQETIKTSSLHHQMMYPFDIKHELIAKSKHNLSNKYIGEWDQPLEIDIEPEIVYFPETKSLCIQGHPEYMDEKTKFVQYCLHLVKEYFK